MKSLVDHINAAKHSILFLAFYPGTPCVSNWAADAQKANKNIFVRGCVTNPNASGEFYYELHGMTPPKKVKGQKTITKEDSRVVAAQALDKTIPKGWLKELLKAGFAVVHDKIVVIDAFSDDCVVATGSHNLGHRASFNNDENLVIVKGNKQLATANATHVLDVYDHFIWRWWVQKKGQPAADQSLKDKPDDWLNTYYDAAGTIKTAQLKFWMSAVAPTP
ncbi:MAG TPA: phospholipase D-like domain-containing protein [Verrucomicrobiae bacterium]|nr:phospholipase D-like domain-containing protein [Verrucomicrobiae bacterium]